MMAEKVPPNANDNDDSMMPNPNQHEHKQSPLAGMPVGPSSSSIENPVIIRYFYEGGILGQGRLCNTYPKTTSDASTSSNTVINIAVPQIIETLQNDGVDFDTFYACAYESQQSTGGWMPLEPAPRHFNPWNDGTNIICNKATNDDLGLTFTIPKPEGDTTSVSRRIDIKLFHRPKAPTPTDLVQSMDDLAIIDDESSNEHNVQHNNNNEQSSLLPVVIEHSSDALHAISSSVPGGKLPNPKGFFGIGILAPKTASNVGTLWRSAYQLGASMLYTIGGRYKSSSTDTLNVPARIPLIELDDWNTFAEWAAPKAAVWVCIEMGGTPLSEFVHPRNAIYILGSEDHGVPKSIVRGCREVVSLECEMYGSYNVAVAGSIVMYDRLMKQRAKEESFKK